jgi:hypothetical protein
MALNTNNAGYHYAECRILFIVMLNVVMLSAVMLNVVMVSAVMLNVVRLSVIMLCIMVPINEEEKQFFYDVTFLMSNFSF